MSLKIKRTLRLSCQTSSPHKVQFCLQYDLDIRYNLWLKCLILIRDNCTETRAMADEGSTFYVINNGGMWSVLITWYISWYISWFLIHISLDSGYIYMIRFQYPDIQILHDWSVMTIDNLVGYNFKSRYIQLITYQW